MSQTMTNWRALSYSVLLHLAALFLLISFFYSSALYLHKAVSKQNEAPPGTSNSNQPQSFFSLSETPLPLKEKTPQRKKGFLFNIAPGANLQTQQQNLAPAQEEKSGSKREISPQPTKLQQFFSRAHQALNESKSSADKPLIGRNSQATQAPLGVLDASTYSYRMRLVEHLRATQMIICRKESLRSIMSGPSPTQPALLHVIIRKDGSLKELDLVESSGNRLYDQFHLKVIRQANPFPAIPEHLGVSEFKLNGDLFL